MSYSTCVSVKISIGELYDKLSILEVKLDRIADPEKLTNVENEYRILRNVVTRFEKKLSEEERRELARLYGELLSVNRALWDVEDEVRTVTTEPVFVYLARQIPKLNGERYRIKKRINEFIGSDLKEEKSYATVSGPQKNPRE